MIKYLGMTKRKICQINLIEIRSDKYKTKIKYLQDYVLDNYSQAEIQIMSTEVWTSQLRPIIPLLRMKILYSKI